MRLLRAEVTRLFARRFTRLMLLGLVLSLGTVAAVTASQTHKPSVSEVERARSAAAEAREACESQTDPGHAAHCSDIETSDHLPYVMTFHDQMPALLLLFAGLLALFAYLAGASFLGAEWASGGFGSLLLWRPQRGAVLLAKLSALSAAVLGTGVILGAAWVGSIWSIAKVRGDIGHLTQSFWLSLGLNGVRGLTFALVATLLGATVATLGRRTSAALGLVLGYFVAWEIGARLIMNVLRVWSEPYMLSEYVAAFLTATERFYLVDCQLPGAPRFDGYDTASSATCPSGGWELGLAVLLGLTLLAVLSSLWAIRRRDIP